MAVKSIQEWIAGLNPAFFGVNTGNYLGQANSLYQNLAGQLYNADTQEQQLGRNFENNLGNMALAQTRGMESLQNAMANRGTLRSGMTTRGASDIGRQFNEQRANLTSDRQSALSQIAANRLNAESQYNQGLTGLQNQVNTEGYGNMLNNLQTEAATKSAQAQQGYANQMYGLQQQIGNAQLQALQKQNQNYGQQPGQQSAYIPLSQQGPASTTQTPSRIPSAQPVVKPVKRPVYGRY